MTDRRSYDIKKKLKTHYPNAKFSVRIEKYSMGESINVRTDAIKRDYLRELSVLDAKRMRDGLTNDEYTRMEELQDKQAAEFKLILNLKRIMQDDERIDRDADGSILSGGNTYLFIEAMA